jgi:hypothetical protein
MQARLWSLTLNPSPKGEGLQTPEVTVFCMTRPRLAKRWGEDAGGECYLIAFWLDY